MTTRLTLTLLLLLGLNSCMYFLPEGRELKRLREQHAQVQAENYRRQQTLSAKKSEANYLRRQLAAKQRRIQQTSSVPRPSATTGSQDEAAEIRALQQQLQQKEAELRSLNQQINYIH